MLEAFALLKDGGLFDDKLIMSRPPFDLIEISCSDALIHVLCTEFLYQVANGWYPMLGKSGFLYIHFYTYIQFST